MHGFGSFGKGFFRGTMMKTLKHRAVKEEYFQHGYTRARSRREALIIVETGAERIRSAGYSSVLDSHDASNAFNCCQDPDLVLVCDQMYSGNDAQLNKSRYTKSMVRVETPGGEVSFLPQGCTLQGHPNASLLCTRRYQESGSPMGTS